MKTTLILEADNMTDLHAVYLENKKPIDASKFTKEQKKNIVSLYISAQPLISRLMLEIEKESDPKLN